MRPFGQINISKDIHKALKVEAANTGETVKDICEQAVLELLGKRHCKEDKKVCEACTGYGKHETDPSRCGNLRFYSENSEGHCSSYKKEE